MRRPSGSGAGGRQTGAACPGLDRSQKPRGHSGTLAHARVRSRQDKPPQREPLRSPLFRDAGVTHQAARAGQARIQRKAAGSHGDISGCGRPVALKRPGCVLVEPPLEPMTGRAVGGRGGRSGARGRRRRQSLMVQVKRVIPAGYASPPGRAPRATTSVGGFARAASASRATPRPPSRRRPEMPTTTIPHLGTPPAVAADRAGRAAAPRSTPAARCTASDALASRRLESRPSSTGPARRSGASMAPASHAATSSAAQSCSEPANGTKIGPSSRMASPTRTPTSQGGSGRTPPRARLRARRLAGRRGGGRRPAPSQRGRDRGRPWLRRMRPHVRRRRATRGARVVARVPPRRARGRPVWLPPVSGRARGAGAERAARRPKGAGR